MVADFGSRRGGLGETKSGKSFVSFSFVFSSLFFSSLFFLLCFFLPPARRGGWKKTVLRNE
jgi:hypothetical protein